MGIARSASTGRRRWWLLAMVLALVTAVPGGAVANDVADDDDGDSVCEIEDFEFGFDPQSGTISLGVLAATTGAGATVAGIPVLNGHKLYWASVNAAGGVCGRFPVQLVVRDHGFLPGDALDQFQLIKDEVLAFSSSVGSPNVTPLVGPAEAEGIVVQAGSLLAERALSPNIPLNLAGNTYFAQFANGPFWAIHVANPPVITAASRVGVIYQDDPYGRECLAGYDFAHRNLGFNDAYRAGYDLLEPATVPPTVVGAQAAAVDVLFVCGLFPELATMLFVAFGRGYSPAVFGSSPTYNPLLAFAFGGGNEAVGIGFLSSFPYYNLGTFTPFEDDAPAMAEFRSRFLSQVPIPFVELSAFYIFGYTQAQTFHLILEKAADEGDISREGLLEAIEDVRRVDMGYGGGLVGFGDSAKERLPSNEDLVGVPTLLAQRAFGLEPIGGFYEAPFLKDWDPASGSDDGDDDDSGDDDDDDD